MHLSSIYLKAFYQLAQDRNFTKAANNLAITQSAFSTRIANLEKDLEVRLFTREKKNIQLTDTGEKLLRYCEKLYRLEEEVVSSIHSDDSKGLSGTIRFGGFSSILRSAILPALAPLLRDNENLNLSTLSVELNELIELLKSSKVDFILSNFDPNIPSIKADFLGYEPNLLVESKKYKFSGHYLDHDSQDVTTNSYFRLKPELNKNIKKRYLNDVYGLLDGVKLGLGRAVLPKHLIKGEKDLRILHPRTKLNVKLYLLYFDNPYYTNVEKAVIEIINDYFSQNFNQ